jgi:hypothetical protein
MPCEISILKECRHFVAVPISQVILKTEINLTLYFTRTHTFQFRILYLLFNDKKEFGKPLNLFYCKPNMFLFYFSVIS